MVRDQFEKFTKLPLWWSTVSTNCSKISKITMLMDQSWINQSSISSPSLGCEKISLETSLLKSWVPKGDEDNPMIYIIRLWKLMMPNISIHIFAKCKILLLVDPFSGAIINKVTSTCLENTHKNSHEISCVCWLPPKFCRKLHIFPRHAKHLGVNAQVAMVRQL